MENFRDTKYVQYVKYVNISTSRALRRSALYRACGHVRPRHRSDIDSVLIVQRTTSSVAECGTASVFIKGEGCGKHPPTTFAFCPNYIFSFTTTSPTFSVLALPDARMGRSSSMQISVNTKVSIHSICKFRALFVSDCFISFKLNWNHSKLNFSNHIPHAFQVIHEQCSCS